MASIFTKIIQGEIPCEKVYESDREIAFLDILPCSPGHTLVVPKTETAKLEELTEEEAVSLMKSLQKIARAISKAFNGSDYKIILNNGPNSGQEVPHVHFHIIPTPERKAYGFSNRKKYGDGEMQITGDKIRASLNS